MIIVTKTKLRVITDNALIAMECFYYMRKKEKKLRVITLKLEMSKAYDMIKWEFVHGVSCPLF